MSHEAVEGVEGSGGLDTVLGSHVAWTAVIVPSALVSGPSEPFPTARFAMSSATSWLLGPVSVGVGELGGETGWVCGGFGGGGAGVDLPSTSTAAAEIMAIRMPRFFLPLSGGPGGLAGAVGPYGHGPACAPPPYPPAGGTGCWPASGADCHDGTDHGGADCAASGSDCGTA